MVTPHAVKVACTVLIRKERDCKTSDLSDGYYKYVISNYDYVHTGLTYAEGLDCEIFSFRVLEVAYKKAILKSEREHVLLYLHNNKSDFNIFSMENSTDESKYRLTVDEPEDYEVVKILIENLYNKKRFDSKIIKEFLDNHPEVFKINSTIIRNEGLLISLKKDEVKK